MRLNSTRLAYFKFRYKCLDERLMTSGRRSKFEPRRKKNRTYSNSECANTASTHVLLNWACTDHIFNVHVAIIVLVEMACTRQTAHVNSLLCICAVLVWPKIGFPATWLIKKLGYLSYSYYHSVYPQNIHGPETKQNVPYTSGIRRIGCIYTVEPSLLSPKHQNSARKYWVAVRTLLALQWSWSSFIINVVSRHILTVVRLPFNSADEK